MRWLTLRSNIDYYTAGEAGRECLLSPTVDYYIKFKNEKKTSYNMDDIERTGTTAKYGVCSVAKQLMGAIDSDLFDIDVVRR